MSVIIDATMSEVESVIKYARYGANNCMIGNGWEAKELVLCEDCKWWREETDHTCRKWGGALPRKANGYCDDGERREEQEKETKTDHWGYERLLCPNCKAQYTKGQRYCDNCGQKLI